MRARIFVALLIAAALQGFSQTSAPAAPALPKDPRAILDAAAPYYDFSDPALKPWHLKATYQLYDDKGAPTEQGTYEYWWASPKVYRSTWTRPGASRTTWFTVDGKETVLSSGETLNYFEATIRDDLFFPLPHPQELDPSKIRLARQDLGPSGQKFPCVLLIWKSLDSTAGPRNIPGPGNTPTYCFDPILPVLDATYKSDGALITGFDKIVRFQGKFLAKEVRIRVPGRTLFSVTVDEVNGLTASDPALIPSEKETSGDQSQIIPPDAANQSLVKKQQPIYPAEAKAQHITGPVLIEATIGKDGKIRTQHVLYSPSPLLTDSGVECVSKWQYKPHLVNGEAVEIDTLITVIYTMNP